MIIDRYGLCVVQLQILGIVIDKDIDKKNKNDENSEVRTKILKYIS